VGVWQRPLKAKFQKNLLLKINVARRYVKMWIRLVNLRTRLESCALILTPKVSLGFESRIQSFTKVHSLAFIRFFLNHDRKSLRLWKILIYFHKSNESSIYDHESLQIWICKPNSYKKIRLNSNQSSVSKKCNTGFRLKRKKTKKIWFDSIRNESYTSLFSKKIFLLKGTLAKSNLYN